MTTLFKNIVLKSVCLFLMAVSLNACTKKDQPEIDETGLGANLTTARVHNAGVVLIAPYLPALFGVVGYLNEKGDFANDHARARAVFLIQFLVTQDNGRKYSEQDLFLNQLLVNYPAALSLPNSIELTDEEIKLAKGMLEAAKANWREMKDTSVEAFRELFLMRAGKLESREGGWLLSVEERGVDSVLHSLPWSIRQISFLWNPHHVEVIWH
jgi:hypothetical protein